MASLTLLNEAMDDLKENVNEACQRTRCNLDDEETSKTIESSIPMILMNKQLELIHPLEHQWSFWYLKNQQGKDWQENLMKLATFGYVEEFWA